MLVGLDSIRATREKYGRCETSSEKEYKYTQSVHEMILQLRFRDKQPFVLLLEDAYRNKIIKIIRRFKKRSLMDAVLLPPSLIKISKARIHTYSRELFVLIIRYLLRRKKRIVEADPEVSESDDEDQQLYDEEGAGKYDYDDDFLTDEILTDETDAAAISESNINDGRRKRRKTDYAESGDQGEDSDSDYEPDLRF